jgi:hypothetical protein
VLVLPSEPGWGLGIPLAMAASIVALSVSISAMTSPEWISSPSFLSQRVTAPSVIVGDSAGIKIWIGMAKPNRHGRA